MKRHSLRIPAVLWLGLVLLLPGPALARIGICPVTGVAGFADPCLADGCIADASASPVAAEGSCCQGREAGLPAAPARTCGSGEEAVPASSPDCCVVMALGSGAPVVSGAPAPAIPDATPAPTSVATAVVVPVVPACRDADGTRPPGARPFEGPLVLRV